METLSWKQYDAKHNLSATLTAAARSCVEVRAARPVEFLAAYFTKKCTGDEIRRIQIHTLYLPNGDEGIQITLHLLNGMESQSTASVVFPSRQTVEGGTGVNSDAAVGDVATSTGNLIDSLNQNCIPLLIQCGACEQTKYDQILRDYSSTAGAIYIGKSVAYAFSMAAASAAARCLPCPLFKYIHKSMEPSSEMEIFAMPQLCINFFGPENLSTARVAVKDVLLIPVMPEGSIRRDTIQQIFAAFRHFSKAHNTTSRRCDGSIAFDGFESLTEAVNLAEEAVRAVGLTPVKDVCVGLRMGAAVVPTTTATNTSTNTNNNTAATATGKETKETTDVMYALFPGDVEVTGSQLSEYVREQLQQHTDFVVYVEDTHSDKDTVGLRRLQAILGGSLTVSGRDLFAQSQYQKIVKGLQELWTSNIVLNPSDMGTLTELYNVVRTVKSFEGRNISFATEDLVGNAAFLGHLSIGLGARFICLGGLLSFSQCEVLSYVMGIQDDLLHSKMLLEEAPKMSSMKLPEAPTDIVPEIKRRMEKKKRRK
ncbi:hypothetical protein LSM04_000828 [Trypanosoma melophagium]|uniref:uncharacterized protein n=1 Tax=Trypanosoma melophagium TaxID=715481 RepID=UPI00351A5C0F|nr:hypothetical protein LSM04_000828 [Trypanosoma melophagium]